VRICRMIPAAYHEASYKSEDGGKGESSPLLQNNVPPRTHPPQRLSKRSGDSREGGLCPPPSTPGDGSLKVSNLDASVGGCSLCFEGEEADTTVPQKNLKRRRCKVEGRRSSPSPS